MGLYEDLQNEATRARLAVSVGATTAADAAARLPAAQEALQLLLATSFAVLQENQVRASIGFEPEHQSHRLYDLIPGPDLYRHGSFGFTAQGDLYHVDQWRGAADPVVARAVKDAGGREVLFLGARVYVVIDSSSGERFRLHGEKIVFDNGWGLSITADRWAKDAVLELSKQEFQR